MSRIDDLIAQHCPNGVEFKNLGEVILIKNGKDHKYLGDGDIPVYGSGGVMRYVDSAAAEGPSVLIPRKGSLGNIFYVEGPFWVVDTIFRTEINSSLIEPKFVYYQLMAMGLGKMNQAGGVPSQTQSVLKSLRIPVPPLEVQREIVRVLDQFTALEAELEAELEARQQQYDHHRKGILSFSPGTEWVKLSDVAEYTNGKAHEKLADPEGEAAMVTARFISRNGQANRFVRVENIKTPAVVGDVALVLSDLPNGRALARTFYIERDNAYAINQRVARLRVIDPSRTSSRFVHHFLNRNSELLRHDNGFDQTHLSKAQVTGLRFPALPLQEQHRLVAILDKFDALVNDLSVGLPAELAARRKQYEYYRDKLLTFEEAPA